MTRVTRHLAALALAGTVASGALVAGTPAFAGTAGGTDSLVNISDNNLQVVNANVTIPVAANICGISVNAVTLVDKTNQKTKCTALSKGSSTFWVTQN
jgi:hypothetical protein